MDGCELEVGEDWSFGRFGSFGDACLRGHMKWIGVGFFYLILE
jgi:hypothetical protein